MLATLIAQNDPNCEEGEVEIICRRPYAGLDVVGEVIFHMPNVFLPPPLSFLSPSLLFRSHLHSCQIAPQAIETLSNEVLCSAIHSQHTLL